MRRREVITFIGGAAASMAAPWFSRAEQAMPVIGLLMPGSAELNADRLAAFSQGLSEAGFVTGRNVASNPGRQTVINCRQSLLDWSADKST